ncbi:hypothetical protein PMAG_b0554 [Pseudoalteromonas mariniglutinosa NCIMB 1770]|nr:hypothetical protein [Pseudoalteromonas mariniglutinosa NCIMB 1770]
MLINEVLIVFLIYIFKSKNNTAHCVGLSNTIRRFINLIKLIV